MQTKVKWNSRRFLKASGLLLGMGMVLSGWLCAQEPGAEKKSPPPGVTPKPEPKSEPAAKSDKKEAATPRRNPFEYDAPNGQPGANPNGEAQEGLRLLGVITSKGKPPMAALLLPGNQDTVFVQVGDVLRGLNLEVRKILPGEVLLGFPGRTDCQWSLK